MFHIRKSSERGHADHGWLKSQHTFSFANYHDPRHMGFRALRVINEDYIAGGTGFGAHPHRDMEIITYIVKGSLQHKDSMGTTAVIRPGEVQYMSAGTGVVHSEFNAEDDETTHLLQIWILPKAPGGAPTYGQKSFAEDLAKKKLVLAASPDGREGSIAIRQDADLYVSRLKQADTVEFALRPTRGGWLQLVKGALLVNGHKVAPGDGAIATDTPLLKIEAQEASEFLLFDLAEFAD